MSIIKVVREQSAIGFDGRIIVQDKQDSGRIGEVLLSNGELKACRYRNRRGEKALLSLLVRDFISDLDISLVVEPEVVTQEMFEFSLDLKNLESRLKSILEETEKNKKLRPPNGLKLLVDSDFICRGDKIEAVEFDILCTISDFAKVADIYENSSYLDFEVTNALVSLRKKRALKVISNK